MHHHHGPEVPRFAEGPEPRLLSCSGTMNATRAACANRETEQTRGAA